MPASPLASGLRAYTAPVRVRISLALAVSLVTSTLVACGALGSSPVRTAQNQSQQGQSRQDQLEPVAISLSPGTGTLVAGSRQQFTSTVTNSSDSAVIWSASMGQVSRDGLYVAPEVQSETEIRVTARSAKSNESIATATLLVTPRLVNPWSSPVITAGNVPAGTAGTGYSSRLGTNGSTSNYQGRSDSGSSPQNSSAQPSSAQRMSLDSARGPIAGTSSPSRTSVSAVASSLVPGQPLAPSVASPAVIPSGTFDGPAELPRAYVQSGMVYTPAPGGVTHVAAGGDLQAALNNAKCGDTIELQAGTTYTGVFTFPAKNCDDNHWIIVRTGAPDSKLPPEGTRITPCYAGVSSLPGRPDFHCAATANVMSRLVIDARQGSGPIQFASGANHYRLLGLEVTRRERGSVIYSLASIDPGGTADHIVYDRLWMHGTAQEETERGVQLGGSTYVAVVDSFFTDFHCIAKTGACGDSQSISGGTGRHPMGPYQIVNNFLEAGAESIIFGGGSATQTPADIEIRHNHMFKPLTWKRGNAGYVGGADGNPFIVKNLFELKNAQRVLFEGNILEDSWGGFSQAGFGILLTPKNQAIGNDNVCPICQVTDVTIRYVTISHVGSGLQIGDGLSDNGGAALAGKRYSIHDVVVDDIDPTRFFGTGNFAQVSMGVNAPVLQSVAIDHVTAFPPNVMFNIGDNTKVNPQMSGFTFTNSIINAGSAPMRSTGGGPANCAYFDSPLTTLNACFASYSFKSNVIIASPDKFFGAWPSGNIFPANAAVIHFVNYQSGNGGDYHLDPASPYKNAATDGKDLGADMDAVATATANVE
jgi:hypothetical protein